MKNFPIEQLEETGSTMNGSIVFNPFSNIPPSLLYSIEIEFCIKNSNEDSLSFTLDGISLPEKDWRKFSGLYRAPSRWEGGSVYIDSAHNPIDVYYLQFKKRNADCFDVEAELFIDFEFQNTPYQNIKVKADFPTKFTGISFRVPLWNDPSAVKYPTEWRIPSEYTQESVDELVSRFAVLDSFEKKFENGAFVYLPKVES